MRREPGSEVVFAHMNATDRWNVVAVMGAVSAFALGGILWLILRLTGAL